MKNTDSRSLGIIAGKDEYPLLLAESAKKYGIDYLYVIAFKKETDRRIEKIANKVDWIPVGNLSSLLNCLTQNGIKRAVMAGQISPTNLFNVRMDVSMLKLLASMPTRNAHTIFGAVADKLKENGVDLVPASTYMDEHMADEGVLTNRQPSGQDINDIELGLDVARTTSALEIGQTVVIKEGTILAVEAFEGTNETIKRAARLGGKNIIVVKVAKKQHDMRFDIPVVGTTTIKLLQKHSAGVLAVEAGRAILLDREKLIKAANKADICVTAVKGNIKNDK